MDYSEARTRNALRSLKRVYRDQDQLKQITKLSGVDASKINFNKAPNLLPMDVMDRAAAQGRMTHLLVEVLSDASSAAIHDDLWKLLGENAPLIHEQALATRADFDRIAALPSPSTYAVNGTPGGLEKIVNLLAKFNDPALFRFELAQREARIVRVEISGVGKGTGWLVSPDLMLTAYHVISPATHNWDQVRVRLDYKFVPQLEGLLLGKGREVKLADQPLLAHSGHAPKAIELSEAGPDASLLDFALVRLAEPVGSQGLGPQGQGDEPRGHFELPAMEHAFHTDEGLFVLGHPQLKGDKDAGPLKFTFAVPGEAEKTKHACRVRYSVNTEGGNSGSPVMDQEFRPLALHHAGAQGQPQWDQKNRWEGGFNQGIPLHLIVGAIRDQVEEPTLAALGLQ
ncbi:MAG: trypsin-like peptidase domain-containing protein [Pseudomonadota bacterium]